MNPYGIALFLHIFGLIALFSGLVILQRGGVRLRMASTWEEARVWLGLMRPVGGMFFVGSLFLLLTGMYMTHLEWSTSTPWVVVGEVVVVAFAIVGAIVSIGLTRMRREARQHEGEISREDESVVRAPALWATIFAMNGGAMAMVWLMTTKPGWAVSIAVPVVLTLGGAWLGMSVSKGKKERPSMWEPIPSWRGRFAQ